MYLILNESSSGVCINPLNLEVIFTKGLVYLKPFILDCQNKKKISLRYKNLSTMNKHNYFFYKKFKLKNHFCEYKFYNFS